MTTKVIKINGEDTNYIINSDGQIFNTATNKELKGTVSAHGYRVITFTVNKKKINKYLHRLMAIYFLNFDEDSKEVINHIDGNKLNNQLSNLEIVSSTDNLKHAYKNNLKKSNKNKKCVLFTENLPNEIWIKALDYKDYEVSNFGRVKSLKYNNPILLRQEERCGYLSVSLSNEQGVKHYTVHELVFFSFNKNKKDKDKVIDHIDGNKKNNSLENLRYISQSENLNASLYEQKNLDNRCKSIDVYKDNTFINSFPSISECARQLKIDGSSISKICKGKMKSAHGYTFRYSE